MSDISFAVLPLDPGRAVSWITAEVDSASERDENVRTARALLEERIGGLSDADREALTATLWAWLRNYILCQPWGWPPFGVLTGPPPALLGVRVGLANGNDVLRTIQDSLDTVFSSEVLEKVSREARQVAALDARRTNEMDILKDELKGGADVTPQAAAVAVAFVAGVVIGVAASEVYYHHIAHHD
jgi:hypothetical protein